MTPRTALTLWLLTAAVCGCGCGCARAPGVATAPPGEASRPEPVTTAVKAPLITEQDDAQAIVAKSVKAFGGPEMFSRWSVGKVTYKATGSKLGIFAAGATTEETFELPGRFKRSVKGKAPDGTEVSAVYVINGDKGWARWGDGTLRPIPDVSAAQMTRPLIATSFDVTLMRRDVPTVVETENDTVVVTQTIENNRYAFYFDKATGLLVKSVQPYPAKPETTSETVFADYKEFDGGMVPTRMTNRYEGKVILDVTILDAKFVKQWDESVFAKP